MNILVVNWLDRENPKSGGAEVHLHQVFGRLVERGHTVTLLCSGWKGASQRTDLDGIQVHRSGGRHTFNLTAPPYFRRHLRRMDFDVVIEDLNKVPVFSPLWVRSPVVLLVHHLFGATAFQEASVPFAAATWLLERPVPRMFRRSTTVAVSQSTADDLVDRGLPAEVIQVIPNGIDLERFAPDPDTPEYPRPTLLYLGRLKKYKRVDLIIRAVSRLAGRDVRCRLNIAGRGNWQDELEDLCVRHGVWDSVEFLGFISEEKKLELLQRSWINVITSPKEGWGISNLEAAACGTPTVASDAPGLRDSVVDGHTGYLVAHEDVVRLSEKIEELIKDNELRARMRLQARAFAEGFSWDSAADLWEELLRDTVAQTRDRY